MAKLTLDAQHAIIECIIESQETMRHLGYDDAAEMRRHLLNDFRVSQGYYPTTHDYDFGGIRGKIRYLKAASDSRDD